MTGIVNEIRYQMLKWKLRRNAIRHAVNQATKRGK